MTGALVALPLAAAHAPTHAAFRAARRDQTLSDLNMYIETPPGVRARHLDVKITANQLTVGLRGNPPFIDEPFLLAVDSSESTWTLEDGILHLSLTKGSKGTTWDCLLKGHTPVDPLTQSEVQKSLMLERFQAEVWERVRPNLSLCAPRSDL